MGTPDDLFRFLLKIATDVPTMTRLSSGDPAQVDEAFAGADLSENQKDAIRNGSEANVRAELSLAPGFVFNQSGFTVFNQSGFVAEPGPETGAGGTKVRKARKPARKTSKPAKASKAAKATNARKASKASKAAKASRAGKPSRAGKASKGSKRAVKKSKGRKK